MALLLTVLFLTSSLGQAEAILEPRQSEADELEETIELIVSNASSHSEFARYYEITESSINSFFHFKGSDFLPSGVRVSECRLLGTDRVLASVTVEFEDVLTRAPSGLLHALKFLKGRVEISSIFSLSTENRFGQLRLESVRLGSIEIPSSILVNLIRSYTRSDKFPDGFNLGSRFSLPYGLETIRVDTGVVSIVQ